MSDEDKPGRAREVPLTYEAYAALPDDGKRYELVGGKLELMAGASTKHQAVATRMIVLMTNTCDEEYLILGPPLDVILSPTEVRQPDLVAVHRSRFGILTARGVEGPPDLVAEVLSPWSAKRDKIDKAKTYAGFGIPEYWIVDPTSARLDQYVLAGDRYDLSDVYAGDEPMRSAHLNCVAFTMNELMRGIPDLPET